MVASCESCLDICARRAQVSVLYKIAVGFGIHFHKMLNRNSTHSKQTNHHRLRKKKLQLECYPQIKFKTKTMKKWYDNLWKKGGGMKGWMTWLAPLSSLWTRKIDSHYSLFAIYKRVIQANLVTCLDNRKFCIARIQRRFPHNPLHRYSGPGCYNFCGECVHRYHKRKSSHPRPPTETILRLLSGRKACIISISVAMKTWTLLISNQCTLK